MTDPTSSGELPATDRLIPAVTANPRAPIGRYLALGAAVAAPVATFFAGLFAQDPAATVREVFAVARGPDGALGAFILVACVEFALLVREWTDKRTRDDHWRESFGEAWRAWRDHEAAQRLRHEDKVARLYDARIADAQDWKDTLGEIATKLERRED